MRAGEPLPVPPRPLVNSTKAVLASCCHHGPTLTRPKAHAGVAGGRPQLAGVSEAAVSLRWLFIFVAETARSVPVMGQRVGGDGGDPQCSGPE